MQEELAVHDKESTGVDARADSVPADDGVEDAAASDPMPGQGGPTAIQGDAAGLGYDENGYIAYYADGAKASKAGIDVSLYQGEIDWSAVRASGIEFAIIRLGANDGGYSFSVDPYLEYNISAARAAGLELGVYFYSSAQSADEASAEAAFTLATLGGRTLELPVVFDCEYGLTGMGAYLDAATMDAAAMAFCDAVAAAGYMPMVYGNADDFACYSVAMGERYELWFANFGASAPGAGFPIRVWQYSCAGYVPGVPNVVDLDLLFTQGPTIL